MKDDKKKREEYNDKVNRDKEQAKQKENEDNSNTDSDVNAESEKEEVVEEITEGKDKKNHKDNKKDNGKIEELTKKLEESERKAEEYRQSWYRAAADFENYKKRHSDDRVNAYADGRGDVIKSILTIGDNLDRALATVTDEKTKAGLELVIRNFADTLKSLGVTEVNPVGELFDPNFHEAVHQVEEAEGSGTVKSVFRKGYSLNGKMLRYAQVVVIK